MVHSHQTGARPRYWVLIGLAALCASLGYAAGWFALFPPEDENQRRIAGLFLPLCFFLLALLAVVLAKVVRALHVIAGSGERSGGDPKRAPVRPR